MADKILIETVTTDSFSMDYFKFGHGEKSLVIIPGLAVQSVMGSAELVAGAYEAATDDYTVYVFDRRKDMPAVYPIRDMACDTAEAIKALGLSSVAIFGASQGGMIAMEIAIEHPQLADKLVLGSTAARIEDDRFAVIDDWIGLAGESKSEELYLSFGEAIYPESIFEQSKDLLVQAAGTVTGIDLDRFIIQAESMRGFDITFEIGSISCPVLVLGSCDDKVLGAEASQLIADMIPGAEVYMYDCYGHAAYDTAPDYLKRVLEFLDR